LRRRRTDAALCWKGDNRVLYQGEKTGQISFPLGGIGSGCIGLAGDGRLVDWEIFNRPNKGSVNGFSHFAIRAEEDGRVVDARVLHGDHQGEASGESTTPFASVGFGVRRAALAGVPHFRSVQFEGAYPLATLRFSEERFPGQVALRAFNPFIPLDEDASSIPAAFFEVEVHNTTNRALTYTVYCVVKNPLATGPVATVEGGKALTLGSNGIAPDDPAYGDLTVATDAAHTSYQRHWYRGGWFDNVQVYWRDLHTAGPLTDRYYDAPPPAGREHDDHGALAVHVTLAPGEQTSVRFVLAWHFPNATNYWNPEPCACAPGETCAPTTWKNYYSTLFSSSRESAAYALAHWQRLHAATLRFQEALFSSTVPAYVLDAVSANMSILKSPTVLRLEDGSLYGFEGCHGTAGCCEGTCTHVWNYAYALPFLFPRLERTLRDLDYRYNMRFDGKMGFRLQLPLGRAFSDFHAAADGQFGGVIKVYRDWKICGDSAWLRGHWPAIKKSIAFAWQRTNEDRWDPQRTGVLQGRQHHTLDTELFGPNAYLTGFYLAALKAGAEMADHLDEPETAREYRALFHKGKAWADAHLFNGSYYQQLIDVTDRAILAPYKEFDAKFANVQGVYEGVEGLYWDEEHGQIKHQIAEGCHIDQVIAQWHANLCGLGEIFNPGQVRSALAAIYRHNFKPSMREFFNPCRVFALDDEAALVICDWPEGSVKPAVPLTYAEEAMNGFEYQAAIHMIQEGLVEEGLQVVKAVRDRYDGARRNPWNEFECGSNYARSMASYALLPALSGFEYDMTRGYIGFAPVPRERPYRCFWSLDSAWGVYEADGDADGQRITLRVEVGTLLLLGYADSALRGAASARVPGHDGVRLDAGAGRLEFSAPVAVTADAPLRISVAGGR